MNCQITQISCHAERILQAVSCGSVHSVYRRTINLTAGGQLLALQAAGSPLSPVSLASSLTADAIESLPVKKGDAIKFSDGCLEILTTGGTVRFSYLGARSYDLKLSGALSPDAAGTLAANISAALSSARTGGFDKIFSREPDGELPPALSAAKKRMAHAMHLYKNKKYPEAGLALSRLLGLGTGLTPSGDDFLCGALAGLHLMRLDCGKFAVSLKKEIAGHLSDTVDISAAFLSCALEGQYSLAVNRLGSLPSAGEILADFSAIGHSSGMDTLCGVLFALELEA